MGVQVSEDQDVSVQASDVVEEAFVDVKRRRAVVARDYQVLIVREDRTKGHCAAFA